MLVGDEIAWLSPAGGCICRRGPLTAFVFPLAHEKVEIERVVVEPEALTAAVEDPAEEGVRLLSLHENIVVRHFLVLKSRGDHDSLDAHLMQHGEQAVVLLGPVAAEDRRVRAHSITGLAELLDRFDSDVIDALALDSDIVRLSKPVQMDNEGKIRGRSNDLQRLLVKQSIRTEVHEPFLCDGCRHDLADLRVHQRLAPGDRDDGGVALFHRTQALVNR